MFIDPGPSGSRPAELVKPAGNAASQMRPNVLSGPQRVYKHATPDGVVFPYKRDLPGDLQRHSALSGWDVCVCAGGWW